MNRNGWDTQRSTVPLRRPGAVDHITPSPPSESRNDRDPGLPESSQCLARALAPQVCDTPLLRADVTRLGSLGDSSPLEDEGPSSSNNRLVQDPSDTRLPLRKVERLGQDVRPLVGRIDADQLHVAVLHLHVAMQNGTSLGGRRASECRCYQMMCLARSRPPMAWFPHSMRAV
jgi:hypothetical protein